MVRYTWRAVIMDEIYHGLTFGKKALCALTFRTAIIINSFSKYFCMTGWRLGWMVVPDDLVEVSERLAQNLYVSAATLNRLGRLRRLMPMKNWTRIFHVIRKTAIFFIVACLLNF